MAVTTWKPRAGGPVTVLAATDFAPAGTGLSSTQGCLGATASNTTDGDEYGVLLLTLALSATVAAGATVELYFVQQVAGTYEDAVGGATPIPPQMPAYIFALAAGTGAHVQTHATPMLPLPPADFKALVVQKSGVQLQGSGSSLTMQKYSEQTV